MSDLYTDMRLDLVKIGEALDLERRENTRLRTALTAAQAEGERLKQEREWAWAAIAGDAVIGNGSFDPLSRQIRSLRSHLAAAEARGKELEGIVLEVEMTRDQDSANARAEGRAEGVAMGWDAAQSDGPPPMGSESYAAASRRIAGRVVRDMSDELVSALAYELRDITTDAATFNGLCEQAREALARAARGPS